MKLNWPRDCLLPRSISMPSAWAISFLSPGKYRTTPTGGLWAPTTRTLKLYSA